MRYDSPAKITARYISRDITIENVKFKEGYKVWLSFRLANFSDNIFKDPFDFCLRNTNLNLSLGLGPHYCIGKELTYKLTLAIINYLINSQYNFNHDLTNYYLEDSVVFRRYLTSILINKTKSTRL